MKHILIVSISQDVHADRIEEILRPIAGVIRLNMDKPELWNFEYVRGDVIITANDQSYGLDEINSVFLRRLPSADSFDRLVPDRLTKYREYISRQKFSVFFEGLAILNNCVPFVNSLKSNEFLGKSVQHFMALKHGLLVPDTYVGHDPNSAINFFNEVTSNGARVCTKPVDNIKLEIDGGVKTRFTQILRADMLDSIQSLNDCPLIFQSYADKKFEIRGTIIGSKILAARIDSQSAPGETSIDWRRYNIPKTPHSIHELPPKLCEQLISFHSAIGATYSSFDLVFNHQEEYIFLETNPFGQWLWIEDLTGLPISKAIAEYLLGETQI